MTNLENGWSQSRLEKLTSLIKDGSHGTHNDVPDGVPLLSAKDVRDGTLEIPDDCRRISETDYASIHRNYKIGRNDILLTIVGSIGRCYLMMGTESRFSIQRSVAVIRPDSVVPVYLYHFFRSEAFQKELRDLTNASAQGGVYLASLAKCLVRFPSSELEQATITEILSTVDRAIEQTEALIAKQQRIKTGLMQDLLTRGIDEHGNLRSAQTHQFKDSPLGRIPVEWEVVGIDEIAKITTGGKDTQDRDDSGVYPFFVRSQTIEKINSFSFDGEGVLTAGDGVGVGKVFHYYKGKFDFHQRVYCIHSFANDMDGYFFFHYFRLNFMSRVSQFSAKGSVDSVRMAMIAKMLIPKPSQGEQVWSVEMLRKVEVLEVNFTETLSKLRSFKTALMQDLLTGKKRVTALLNEKEAAGI